MADPINVAVIGKNQREEVRIMLDTFKGAQLVDMRVFSAFTSNNIMMPTKKGLSLRVEMLSDLIDALSQARDQAEILGWIGGGK